MVIDLDKYSAFHYTLLHLLRANPGLGGLFTTCQIIRQFALFFPAVLAHFGISPITLVGITQMTKATKQNPRVEKYKRACVIVPNNKMLQTHFYTEIHCKLGPTSGTGSFKEFNKLRYTNGFKGYTWYVLLILAKVGFIMLHSEELLKWDRPSSPDVTWYGKLNFTYAAPQRRCTSRPAEPLPLAWGVVWWSLGDATPSAHGGIWSYWCLCPCCSPYSSAKGQQRQRRIRAQSGGMKRWNNHKGSYYTRCYYHQPFFLKRGEVGWGISPQCWIYLKHNLYSDNLCESNTWYVTCDSLV